MPTPLSVVDADDRHIVIDCAVCHRTIWAGTKCLHGQIPPPSKIMQAYPPIEEEKVPVIKGKKFRKH